MANEIKTPEVKVGQVWRKGSRHVEIMNVSGRRAACAPHDGESERFPRNRRFSHIAYDQLRKRWKLIKDAPTP